MSSNLAATNSDEVVIFPTPPQPPKCNRPTTIHSFTSVSPITDHNWAIDHPDVRKACYLARVCPVFGPKACRLKDIPSILQEGPTCGLAALSMLGLGEPSPSELLAQAKEQQFTTNGEMFSAVNLLQLARQQTTSEFGEVRLYDGPLCCDEIRRSLCDGQCLLVPYPFF